MNDAAPSLENDLTSQGVICLNLADEYKMPFIKFYGV